MEAEDRVVVLSGPPHTRIYQEWNSRLTFEGSPVLLVTLPALEGKVTQKEQEVLDTLRPYKIEIGTDLFVLDVGGVIDEKTQRDIEIAQELGKRIRYLSQEHPEWPAWKEGDYLWAPPK